MELSYELAEKALQAAIQKARSLNIPVSIAIVDKVVI
jgi:uncharacterized protein GlcG (DUF336 family)